MDTSTRTTITNLYDITDFDEDDNAPLVDIQEVQISDQPGDFVEDFIDDLVETFDAYLWTLNAVVPHKSMIDGDELDDMAAVFTKFEKEELFGEIYAVYQTWFSN